jgi:hypothetical protein
MPVATVGSETVPSPPLERQAPPSQNPEGKSLPDFDRKTAFAAIDTPSPFAADSEPVEGTLRLVVSVEESCWLEIAADGNVVISGLKDHGFRQEVTALRELRLWLGNAGGVKLLLNDRPAMPLGRAGQVRKDVTITLENYRDFVSSADRS